MAFIYKRGDGARRRVMHLSLHDSRTGEPTMRALCGSRLTFDTSCNLPLGQPVCKPCSKAWGQGDGDA